MELVPRQAPSQSVQGVRENPRLQRAPRFRGFHSLLYRLNRESHGRGRHEFMSWDKECLPIGKLRSNGYYRL